MRQSNEIKPEKKPSDNQNLKHKVTGQQVALLYQIDTVEVYKKPTIGP